MDTFVRMAPMLHPVFALIAGYMSLDALLPPEKHARANWAMQAVLFSAALVYALATSVEYSPGVRIDARFPIIGTAVVFGGPLVATITVAVGIAFRETLGGVAQLTGQLGMVWSLASFLLLNALLGHVTRRKGLLATPKQRLLVALGGMLLSTLGSRIFFWLHIGADQPVPWAPGLTVAALTYQGFVLILLFCGLLFQYKRGVVHRKLVTSEAELRGLLAALPDLLLTFDNSGRILDARKPTPGLLYPDLSVLVGRTLEEMVPEDAAVGFLKAVETAMAGETMIEQQFSTVMADGRTYHADVRIVRLDSRRGLAVLRDRTEKVQQEEQLNGARQKLELLAENTQDLLGLVEPDGCISYVTPSCTRHGGFTAQTQHMEAWRDVLSDEDAQRALNAIAGVRTGEQPDAELDLRVRYPKTDKFFWLRLRYSAVVRDGKLTQQIVFHARNITAVRDLERRARLAELAVQHISDGVLVTRAEDDSIVWCNRGFSTISGYPEPDAIGDSVDQLLNSFPVQGAERKAEALQATGSWSGELLSQRKDGSWFPEWRHVSLFQNPVDGDQYYVKILRDLSRERSQQETTYSLKHRDALTGMPNRGHFVSAVNVSVDRHSRESTPFAVAQLGIRDFDAIVKTYGRSVGDRLLKLVATRVHAKLGDGAPLARVEAHTFALLIERDVSTPVLNRNLRALLGQFSPPFQIDGQDIKLDACIGVARFPDDGDTAESLIHKSQLALDSGHGRSGDGQVVFFQRESADTGLRRLSLETALRKTLLSDTSELYVEYQPRIGLADKQVLGFEALLRWHHPELGQVAPGEFIPMAEESGLIHFLGGWVFEAVCKQLAAWRETGLVLKPVSVNLSVQQMQDERLPQRMVEAARKYAIEPHLIEVEVTESEVMNDLALTSGMLRQLRDMGFSIALDDFGTGYSSMAYLQRLPLDVLKLDRSFVRELGRNRESDEMVRALVAMAHSLELHTVAEGVETEEQRQFLLDTGCHAMQGFLFSPAVSEYDTRSWLAHRPAMLLGVRPRTLSPLLA